MLSRVLGLVRDAGMAVLFGAGPLMDAFTVAFRLPNLARRLFGEGSLTAAFLPVFVRVHQADEARGRRLAAAVAVLLSALLLALVAAGELACWGLMQVAAPPTRRLLELVAILTPYLWFICLAAQLSAVLHALRRFFWPAVLPLVLNTFWIAAVLLAPRVTADDFDRMRLICVIITASGIVQVGLLLVVLRRLGFDRTWSWAESSAAVREIAAGVLPTVIGLSITQLNAVADSLLAWGLSPSSGIAERYHYVESGAATALYLGQRVHQVPLGVFGIALSTVFFPLLAEHAQNNRTAALGADLSRGVRLCLAIGLPSAAGLVVLSELIPRVLFEHGEFTAADSRLTGQMLAGYGLGVWAFMTVPLLNRGFYAAGDRVTPMRIGLAVIAVHLLLDVAGVVWLGGAGLAVATSVAAIVHLLWTAVVIDRRIAPLQRSAIVATSAKAAAVTGVMAAVCVAVRDATAGSSWWVGLLAPIAAAVVVYGSLGWLFLKNDLRSGPADET